MAMVVLKPLSSGDNRLNMDLNYFISAISRCKYECMVVVVDDK